jgi:uncharacterized protein
MTLGSAFHERDEYRATREYRLLPFRFGHLDGGRYVVTNEVGEYVVLERADLVALVDRRLDPSSSLYRALKARHFLFDDRSRVALDLLALKYRTRVEGLASFTGLHIFVVTLRCDHSCHYCQVSRQTEDRHHYDMSQEHGAAALELTFRSPSKHLKIEFQGGEPLLNFDLVRFVVERAMEMNKVRGRDLRFVIASNLSKLSADMLDFCKENAVYLSTSLDGPEDLHEAQRPLRGGHSHQATLDGVRRAREVLGPDFISALMTTKLPLRRSVERPRCFPRRDQLEPLVGGRQAPRNRDRTHLVDQPEHLGPRGIAHRPASGGSRRSSTNTSGRSSTASSCGT